MPELGEINLGPGPGIMQQGTGLTQMLNQQAQQELSKIDREWSDKYQQLNKLYDWSRHEKYPDEITRLRGRLEQDIAGHRQAITTGFGNTISKFKMLDELFMHDPEQAERLKWETMVGKDVAGRMFPQQRDPRDEYRELNATMNQVFRGVQEFVTSRDGKVYHAKEDEDGWLTNQLDKSRPATEPEIAGWKADINAWGILRQTRTEMAQEMAEQGIADPDYLQNVMKTAEEAHWLKRFAKGYYSLTGIGIIHKGVKKVKAAFAPEPKGTFAQKVTETLPQQPQRRQRKQSRQELLAEYRRLGGSQTAEGKAFADRNLR